MKKLIFSLIVVVCFCCSCSGRSTSDKICHLMEKASEKMEQATTLRSIEDINNQLSKNIAVFTLSLTQEEYEQWTEDTEGMAKIEKTKEKYKSIKQQREILLKGK